MKINSCLAFAFLLLLVSCTLAVDTTTQEANRGTDKVQPTYSGGGGGCRGRGCGGGGGGGGGWNCHHGCCHKGYHGKCSQCCHSPEEAKAFAEKQAHP